MKIGPPRVSPTVMSSERMVDIAHYLIQNKGERYLEPAHVEICLDTMPHSHGRDLLILAHHHGRLRTAGFDPWNAFGMCAEFKFSDIERRAYKVLAYQAESTMRAAKFYCTPEMHYRIAGLALTEMVLSDLCPSCNGSGCGDCDRIGRKGWSQTRRIDMLETNVECWRRTLGRAYHYVLLPSLATQEREAAKQFVRTACYHFGDRLEQLLLAAANDPQKIRVPKRATPEERRASRPREERGKGIDREPV